MRIGYISTFPPIECGIASYSYYLTDLLRQKGLDIYVVSHIGGSGPQVFPAFDYDDDDLHEKAYSTMIRFTPDVIHIQHEFGLYGKHWGVNVIPLILKFRLIGIPVVTTLHTVYAQINHNHHPILENILLNSNRVIVHMDYQVESLKKQFGERLVRNVSVIPHGAREVEPISNAKQKLGLPEDKKVILLIGYFRPSKNFELIVDLLPEILKNYQDAILVIAGKVRGQEHVEYRNYLFQKIQQSPAHDHIYLIRGQLPQQTFDTILSGADVVVLPYKINSQSGILAHCLAFGRPVITSNTEAMHRIIRESGSGLIANSEQEYVEHIVKILGDEQFARQLSLSALNYVKTRISWSIVADQHIQIYRNLIDLPDVESKVIVVD